MKPEPTTRARSPAAERPRGVRSRRSCARSGRGRVGAGDRRDERIGAGREQDAIEAEGAGRRRSRTSAAPRSSSVTSQPRSERRSRARRTSRHRRAAAPRGPTRRAGSPWSAAGVRRARPARGRGSSPCPPRPPRGRRRPPPGRRGRRRRSRSAPRLARSRRPPAVEQVVGRGAAGVEHQRGRFVEDRVDVVADQLPARVAGGASGRPAGCRPGPAPTRSARSPRSTSSGLQ